MSDFPDSRLDPTNVWSQTLDTLSEQGIRYRCSRTMTPESCYGLDYSQYAGHSEQTELTLIFWNSSNAERFQHMILSHREFAEAEQDRNEEIRLRENNPLLKDAYDQYRVLLKLITGTDKK